MNRNYAPADETVSWEGAPAQHAAIIRFLVIAGFFGAIWFYFPVFFRTISTTISSLHPALYGYQDTISHAPFALIALLFAWEYLYLVTTRYKLSSERLEITKGLLIRTKDEVELYRVVDVVQYQSVLQMLLAVGTVVVKSTDQTGTVLVSSITKSARVREMIRTSAEACKSRRGAVRLLAE